MLNSLLMRQISIKFDFVDLDLNHLPKFAHFLKLRLKISYQQKS